MFIYKYIFQEKFKSEFKERVFCNDLRRLCCPRLSNPEDEELALGAIPVSQRTNGTLSRNKEFMLDEMVQQNASKFAILFENENPK